MRQHSDSHVSSDALVSVKSFLVILSRTLQHSLTADRHQFLTNKAAFALNSSAFKILQLFFHAPRGNELAFGFKNQMVY